METTYTCVGSVRGACGHRHRTLSGAVRCAEADRAGCEAQGGYSDRLIVGDDGEVLTYHSEEHGWLTTEESDAIDRDAGEVRP